MIMANEKWINGNALMAKFERIAKKSGVPHFHLDEIADEINEADAVEVVRCKDCKHWAMGYCNNFAYYDYEPMTNEDDFCSYGERREGE